MRHSVASTVLAAALPLVFSASIPLNISSSPLVSRDAGYGFVSGTVSWNIKPGPFLLLDGGLAFIVQSDGNLVVYDTHASSVLWSAGVTNQDCSSSRCNLYWQGDGNLVLYNGAGTAFWTTETNASPRHEIPGEGLYFSPNPPYISIYSQKPAYMWGTYRSNGVVVQNPDTQNDPLQNSGQQIPDACQGVSVNCAVCWQSCDGITTGQRTDWGGNAKTFGDTNSAGTGPAPPPRPPSPPPQPPFPPPGCDDDEYCSDWCNDGGDCGD